MQLPAATHTIRNTSLRSRDLGPVISRRMPSGCALSSRLSPKPPRSRRRHPSTFQIRDVQSFHGGAGAGCVRSRGQLRLRAEAQGRRLITRPTAHSLRHAHIAHKHTSVAVGLACASRTSVLPLPIVPHPRESEQLKARNQRAQVMYSACIRNLEIPDHGSTSAVTTSPPSLRGNHNQSRGPAPL